MTESGKIVTVVGTGAMGTLCALLLGGKGITTRLWGRRPEHVERLLHDRENVAYLPGFALPERVTPISSDAQALADCSLIVSAVPCQFVRSVWTRLARSTPPGVPVMSVAKGIEVDTLLLPTQVIEQCVGERPMACFSGPCIASEVAEGKPASVVVASDDLGLADRLQVLFSTPVFRVYTSGDTLGVELAGALKNVIALAGGICDGIGAGCNAKAALVTRGLVEITRLGTAMGAWPDTFRGLAGIGDLITTCISPASRNRSAGERIARGITAEELVASTASVIEGIETTKSVLDLSRKYGVEMPIVSAVAALLFEGVSPEKAIRALMTRPLGAE
jgi:glycerol-3-phosphate dehydrogenase (NAD(P)+)